MAAPWPRPQAGSPREAQGMSGPADWRKGSESTRPDPKRVVASLPLAVFTESPRHFVTGLGNRQGGCCCTSRQEAPGGLLRLPLAQDL